MKPWYLKKKIWVAVIAGIAAVTAELTGNKEMATFVTGIGMTLIAALGIEDFGKGAVSDRKSKGN
jgi:hypothetical protein